MWCFAITSGEGGYLKPILFTIGPIEVASLGVFLLLGLLLSLFIMWRLYKNNLAFIRFNVTLDDFFDSVLVFFIAFGVGARALHVLEHIETFGSDILRWILFLHFPGFSFLGGVAGGVLGLWLFCRKAKLPLLLLLDLLAVGLSGTISLAHVGQLLSGDAFGKETMFFLKVSLANVSGMRHPTQLYEAVLAFAIFVLLYYFYIRGRFRSGELFLYFLLLVGTSRFFIEFLRGDSVYLGGIAVAHIISGLFIVISALLLIIMKQERLRVMLTRS